MGPALSRLQVESDKKHAMTQILWDSRINHAVGVAMISTLLAPHGFVHMDADYMCPQGTSLPSSQVAMALTTGLEGDYCGSFLCNIQLHLRT